MSLARSAGGGEDHLGGAARAEKADQMLAEKVSAIEVLVAGQYIRRDGFEKMATALFSKLDKIYDRLESKADKH